MGSQAGQNSIAGTNNTFLGTGAGLANEGSNNTFLGSSAGGNSPGGSDNVLVGQNAGAANQATGNVFIGKNAGLANLTGIQNTFVGNQVGIGNTAAGNTFVGHKAGFQTTTGGNNTFFGVRCGYNNVDGTDNVQMGFEAGSANSVGSRNTYLGSGADALYADLHNASAIGAGARVGSSNALVLGHEANVGIGTSSPKSKLDVVADEADASGLRLSQLTERSPTTRSTDRFLTVDERGEVILSRYRVQVARPQDWADRVFAPGYALRPLAQVAAYIADNQHLPGVPSAQEMVSAGMDATALNAKLLEKVEELTLYLLEQQTRITRLQQQMTALRRSHVRHHSR